MRDGRKYRIISINTTDHDNPLTWTKGRIDDITDNETVIGYFMKTNKNGETINLYVIPAKYNKGQEVDRADLRAVYFYWLLSMKLNKDNKLVVFHNPPIENWLDTKQQWIKKTASKLSKTFDKSFDEMLSHVNYAIIKAFNKTTVYAGNLGYIEKSAYNEVLMDIRNNRNKLILDNDKVCSLDEEFSIDGTTHTFGEICGEDDPAFKQEEFNEITNEIKKVLSYTFSEREIDQIINSQGQLPTNLYRRLLKWRKSHKRGDFNVN